MADQFKTGWDKPVDVGGPPLDEAGLLRPLVIARIGFVQGALPDADLLRETRELVNASAEYDTTRTRNKLGIIVMLAVLAVMIIAGVAALTTMMWAPVAIAWSIGGPFVGAVIGYYFRPVDKEM